MLESMKAYLKDLEALLDVVNESGDVWRQIRLEEKIAQTKRKIRILETASV